MFIKVTNTREVLLPSDLIFAVLTLNLVFIFLCISFATSSQWENIWQVPQMLGTHRWGRGGGASIPQAEARDAARPCTQGSPRLNGREHRGGGPES